MKWYRMYAESSLEDYVIPGDALDVLSQGCWLSEFQFLDHTPLEVEISDEGGIEFPDFLIHNESIPLISESFRQLLDKMAVDNLFYKRIFLTSSLLGVREPYWLAVPPRIRCLDMEESIIEVEQIDVLPPEELIREVSKIVIDTQAVGNYSIFKLPIEFVNQDIIVSETLQSAIVAESFSNVYFQEL